MSDQYPSRELDKVVIRLPEGLRERIRVIAEENGRSVNSELVTLLRRTYPAASTVDDLLAEIADVISRQPARMRDQAWKAAFEKLTKLRDEEASRG